MLTNDIPLAGSVLIQGGTRVVAKPSGTGIRRKRQLAPHNVLRQRVYSAIAEPATLPFQKDAEHLTAWTPRVGSNSRHINSPITRTMKIGLRTL